MTAGSGYRGPRRSCLVSGSPSSWSGYCPCRDPRRGHGRATCRRGARRAGHPGAPVRHGARHARLRRRRPLRGRRTRDAPLPLPTVLGAMAPTLGGADLAIVNLETAVTDARAPHNRSSTCSVRPRARSRHSPTAAPTSRPWPTTTEWTTASRGFATHSPPRATRDSR